MVRAPPPSRAPTVAAPRRRRPSPRALPFRTGHAACARSLAPTSCSRAATGAPAAGCQHAAVRLRWQRERSRGARAGALSDQLVRQPGALSVWVLLLPGRRRGDAVGPAARVRLRPAAVVPPRLPAHAAEPRRRARLPLRRDHVHTALGRRGRQLRHLE
eukprot:3263997-Prymnesium_polylepis.1